MSISNINAQDIRLKQISLLVNTAKRIIEASVSRVSSPVNYLGNSGRRY